MVILTSMIVMTRGTMKKQIKETEETIEEVDLNLDPLTHEKIAAENNLDESNP